MFAGKHGEDYLSDPMIDHIYNKDVLRLAANISRTDPLKLRDAQPDPVPSAVRMVVEKLTPVDL